MEDHEIHIVGLGIDIAHPQMVALLAAQAERRLARARLIAGRLEKAHIPGALDGALALAEGGRHARAFCAFPYCGRQSRQYAAGFQKLSGTW